VFELLNRHSYIDVTANYDAVFFCTNCISTFASQISILSIFFHDIEFYFFNSLAFLKFVKIEEFYEFLKFIIFAFSDYGSGGRSAICL